MSHASVTLIFGVHEVLRVAASATSALAERVGNWRDRAGTTEAHLRAQRALDLPEIPRRNTDWDLRAREDVTARASDMYEVERIERAWDRNDNGGLRDWEWR